MTKCHGLETHKNNLEENKEGVEAEGRGMVFFDCRCVSVFYYKLILVKRASWSTWEKLISMERAASLSHSGMGHFNPACFTPRRITVFRKIHISFHFGRWEGHSTFRFGSI